MDENGAGGGPQSGTMLSSAICKIRIIRRSQYRDALRSYKVIVNGLEVGTISRNALLDIEAPSGALRVEARIDWGRSLPLLIDAAPSQNIEIEVSNEWPSGLALWAVTFGFRRYLTLKQLPVANSA
jgi:hypothetical protein